MVTYNNRYNFVSSCRETYRILCALNRRRELYRLVQWAQRKHLSGPLRLYRNRLDEEEFRLFRYTVNSPHLTSSARLFYNLNCLLSSTPRYVPKGSGKTYRFNSLTKRVKSHSILYRLT